MKIHCRQISPEFQNVEIGKGTEWVIHNGPNEPELPHEIQGDRFIARGVRSYEIKAEIAAAKGGKAEDVLLWEYAGGFSEEFLNRNRRKK